MDDAFLTSEDLFRYSDVVYRLMRWLEEAHLRALIWQRSAEEHFTAIENLTQERDEAQRLEIESVTDMELKLRAAEQERDAALAVLKSAHEQLERYYNSSDGERDAYEYQDELEACDDAWIKLRARINGEVE